MSVILISNVAGKVPTVSQLLTSDSGLGYNRVDALFYGIKIVGGIKSVVCLGESLNPGVGESHERLHQINSALDHAAALEADRDKLVATNPVTGAIEFVTKSSVGGGTSLVLDKDSANFSGVLVVFTAGETLVKGNLCYLDSTGKMKKTDADAIATCLGIAIATSDIALNASGTFLLMGFIGGYAALTCGIAIYASTSPGALQQTVPVGTDDVVFIAGIAISATQIYFNPSLTTIERT